MKADKVPRLEFEDCDDESGFSMIEAVASFISAKSMENDNGSGGTSGMLLPAFSSTSTRAMVNDLGLPAPSGLSVFEIDCNISRNS